MLIKLPKSFELLPPSPIGFGGTSKSLRKRKLETSLELLVYFVFFVVLILQGYYRALYHGQILWGDDLQWQSWLYRIVYGEVPYRDFFMLYGPVLPFLFLLPFKLLGGDFLAWNLIRYLGLPVLSFLMAVLVSRVVFKTALFRIIFLVIASTFDAWGFFFLQPWDFRFWLGLFTIVILFSELRKRSFWTGAWVAIVFFSSVDQGIYLLEAIVGLAIIKSIDHLRLSNHIKINSQFLIFNFKSIFNSQFLKNIIREFGRGLLWAGGGMVLIMALAGALRPYVDFTFLRLSNTEFAVGGIAFPDFPFDKLNNNIFSFLISKELRFYLPIFVYTAGIIWLIRWIRNIGKDSGQARMTMWKEWSKITFLTFYGIFAFRTALARSDFGHLGIASIPAVIISVWFIERVFLKLIKTLKKERNNLFLVVKTALFTLVIFGSLFFFYLIRAPFEKGFLAILNPGSIVSDRQSSAYRYSNILGVYIWGAQLETLEDTAGFLSQNAFDEFYAQGSLGGMYFLTKSKNPTYFDQYFWADEEAQKDIINLLEVKKNIYIVRLSQDILLKGSLLDDYVNMFYSYDRQFGEIVILKRNGKEYKSSLFDATKIIEGSWKQIGSNVYTKEFNPSTTLRIVLRVNLRYFPFLGNLAKTRGELLYQVDGGEWRKAESDTQFIPKEGVSFHLGSLQKIKALEFSIYSPGGLNPAPSFLDISQTLFYE